MIEDYSTALEAGQFEAEDRIWAGLPELHAHKARQLLRHTIKPDDNVLDIGCGPGYVASEAANHCHYVGLDKSIRCVRAANERMMREDKIASFWIGDARELPYPDDYYQVTGAFSFLKHFSFEDAGRIVQQMARVTKPLGWLVFTMNVGQEKEGHELTHGVTYWSTMASRERIRQWISDAGLSVDAMLEEYNQGEPEHYFHVRKTCKSS